MDMSLAAALATAPLEALELGRDHLVVSPAGAFVLTEPRPGARGDLRARVRDARERLDATGLPAMPVEPLIVHDLEAALDHLLRDDRFGPATIARACRALGLSPAPAFVATIAAAAPIALDHPRVPAAIQHD